MSNRRKAHLDALERRLTGPKRIALFGHRAVGKTTLLAMFYREASTGRVPGVRLAAVDPASAEYLAEKIAQIEAGEPPAGTLAETELKLRLYHGPARLDLIVKDYQGEHVTLGSEDASIHAFFANCDAVLLCLDPDGSASPADRRRRQQEVEYLLERYIERSDDSTADRPIALLVTKYDRVLAQDGPPPDQVESLVEAQYGMTRHALACHAPRGAIFAVSSYGREAPASGLPPTSLHPLGLEGPLGWLADQLEERDIELLEWIWDLAPDDLPRLSRCVRALELRYPRSGKAPEFRRRLGPLKRRRLRRAAARLAVAAALIVGAVAGYDAWGFQRALAFERDNPPPEVLRHWADLPTWHPTLALIWPAHARRAEHKVREWELKTETFRMELGTSNAHPATDLDRLKEEAPELVVQARQVEDARDRKRHDKTWAEIQAETLAAPDQAEKQLASVQSFLRQYPWTPNRDDAVKLADLLGSRVADRRARLEQQEIDALRRASTLPNADLADLIQQVQSLLARNGDGRYRSEAEALQAELVRRLDERDIEKARGYSKQYPANFATRIARYQGYLDAHKQGGRFVREAMRAKDQIEREADVHAYRQAYDHLIAHPDDVAEVARRLRSYLNDHRDGRFAKDAERYLSWFEKISATGEYRVTLQRGEVEPDVGKYFSGGAPDLSVEIWVAGVKYGPSPTIPNTHRPIWDYTFASPVKWKLNDPVVVRILDNDWSSSGVFTFTSRPGDPLAMRNLSGTIKPSKGGKTSLVFTSEFSIPKLTKPQ